MTFCQWLQAHPFVAGVLTMLLPPLVGSLLNWFTWKGTPEQWAAYRTEHPRMAVAILYVRMLLPHLRQIPKIAAFLPPESEKSAKSDVKAVVEAVAKLSDTEIAAAITLINNQPSVTQPIKTPVAPSPDESKPTDPQSPDAKAKEPS